MFESSKACYLRRLICTCEPLLPHPQIITHAHKAAYAYSCRAIAVSKHGETEARSSNGGDSSGSSRGPSDVWMILREGGRVLIKTQQVFNTPNPLKFCYLE